MNDRDLLLLPAWKQREMVVHKEVSSRELVKASLRRIEGLDSQLHAFITVDHDRALETADTADAAVKESNNPAVELGPFHGVPISIKDMEVTKGLRTTLGCRLYEDWVPDYDSVVVERVRKSGAVIIGKTNTPEFGNSGETYTKIAPTCNNPWDLTRTPGGSSGGAAASVVSAMVSIATGTDGGGSVREPCAFSGLYGIKATHGRIPRFGGKARPAVNLTSASGPMTRTVKDTAMLMQALSGHDGRDPVSLRQPAPDFVGATHGGIRGMRIGYSIEMGYAPVDPDIAKSVTDSVKVFEDLGAHVEEAGLELDPPPFEYWWTIWAANEKAMYGHLVEAHVEDLMPYTVEMVFHGVQVTGAEYSQALRQADEYRALLGDYFEKYDLLILPTTAVTAYKHRTPPETIGGKPALKTAAGIPFGALPFTMAFNISWNPAASIPCGFDSNGLPMGLQIVGNIGDEAMVLRASVAFEEARPWADRLPPVI